MANPKGNLSTLKPYTPKWRSGSTQTIRVPVVLADRVLSYTHRLDAGWDEQDFDKQSLLPVIKKLKTVLDTPRNNFSKEKKDLLQSAINELQSLVSVI